MKITTKRQLLNIINKSEKVIIQKNKLHVCFIGLELEKCVCYLPIDTINIIITTCQNFNIDIEIY